MGKNIDNYARWITVYTDSSIGLCLKQKDDGSGQYGFEGFLDSRERTIPIFSFNEEKFRKVALSDFQGARYAIADLINKGNRMKYWDLCREKNIDFDQINAFLKGAYIFLKENSS